MTEGSSDGGGEPQSLRWGVEGKGSAGWTPRVLQGKQWSLLARLGGAQDLIFKHTETSSLHLLRKPFVQEESSHTPLSSPTFT